MELERHAEQVEILAVELLTAVQVGDLQRATRQLQSLREQVALIESTIVALIGEPGLVGAGVSLGLAASHPASRADDRGPEQLALEAKERVLAETLIAVLVQFDNLSRAVSTSASTRFAGGLIGLDDIAHFVRNQIGHLNAAWLWGKRIDRAGALTRAVDTLRSIGKHRGLVRFLDETSRLESEAIRRACAQLAVLLELNLEDQR